MPVSKSLFLLDNFFEARGGARQAAANERQFMAGHLSLVKKGLGLARYLLRLGNKSSNCTRVLAKVKKRQKQRAKFGVLSLMMLASVGILTVEASPKWQTVESIRMAALAIAKKDIRLPNSTMDFHVGVLDSRHRLPLCDKPLQGFLLDRTRITTHTTVGVRCDGQKSWQVYVPIQINVYKRVLVTVRPVPKGQTLTDADVRLERRNVAGRQYVTDTASVTHQQVRRDLAPGTQITPSMLRATHIVKKGQIVTIFNKNNGLHIRMAGVALQDGHLNQRIRIRNQHSNKELEGIVRSPQTVEIML